jgi:retinol dehydrogenase-12
MSSWSVRGKTCLVTGASSGIGLETARGLAAEGATVWIVVRSEDKGRAAIDEIKKTVPDAKLELVLCDFSSLASIRACGAELRERLSSLHVLVNNAGAVYMARETSVDGFEMTFAVNHLGYFAFTRELLPLLEKGAPARIVNVSSDAHRGSSFDFEDPQSEKGYTGFVVYQRSKLANIYFTYELAERLADKGITVNCLHPGVIATGFGRNQPGFFKFLISLGAPFLASPAKGARTSVFLATSPTVDGVTGKYFARSREQKSSRVSHDPGARKRLWELSETLVGTA